jgi:hypothetical protein
MTRYASETPAVMTRLALTTLLLALAACSGINLSGGPGPITAKDTGPLTVPPHMADGSRQ